jgi:murein DD-endopeptidase MepM/ murein hydrolase activator NlpD
MGSACGNGIIIKSSRPSGGDVYAVYEHLSFSGSSSGAVSQGTTIGWMAMPPAGKSGGCWTGYHVHVGIQTQGTYIESHRSSYHADPCDYITGC